MGSRAFRFSSELRAAARRARGISLIVATVALVACGGYGGGSSYSPPSSPPATGTAAPPGTSSGMSSGSSTNTTPPAAAPAMAAAGPITGFGTVHLNGLVFETTGATIMIDGSAGTQDDLRAGEFIQVKGHHDAAQNQDLADQIDFRGNVIGPVDAIDTTAQTLVVLGQTVHVTEDTSFDDDISPASLAGIAAGAVVEVSGMVSMDGSIQATRIEGKPAAAHLQVIGTAAATDSTAKTLMINALVVDFSTATLVGFTGSAPHDGDVVEATGTTLSSAGVLLATRLELRAGKVVAPPDINSQVDVQGLISRFASATDFDVAGLKVSTSGSTIFTGGSAADLGLNTSVEVTGVVDSAGTIEATNVQIRRPVDARLTGPVDSVDAAHGKVVVLGIQISVDLLTRYEDHGSGGVNTFNLAFVHAGDWLEVRGAATSTSGTSLEATRIDRVQRQSQVQLMGVVASASQPFFKVLGTSVATDSSTSFNHGLNATSFFASGPVGQTVSITGTWDGSVLTANDVNIGDDNGDDDNGGLGKGGGDGGGNDGGGGNNGGGDGGGGGGGGGPGPG